jgi:hypothetical protein
VVIWYIFPRFGILCEERSGNPQLKPEKSISVRTWDQCYDKKGENWLFDSKQSYIKVFNNVIKTFAVVKNANFFLPKIVENHRKLLSSTPEKFCLQITTKLGSNPGANPTTSQFIATTRPVPKKAR